MKETTTLIGLGVASSVYAAYLNTDVGKEFADEHTWVTVVVGTSIVLAAARLLMPYQWWRWLVIAFGVGGAPLAARSLFNKWVVETDGPLPTHSPDSTR